MLHLNHLRRTFTNNLFLATIATLCLIPIDILLDIMMAKDHQILPIGILISYTNRSNFNFKNIQDMRTTSTAMIQFANGILRVPTYQNLMEQEFLIGLKIVIFFSFKLRIRLITVVLRPLYLIWCVKIMSGTSTIN
jgi:hypothetical protein